ncbi:unnamed protein product [Caenorhabditis brenneri]
MSESFDIIENPAPTSHLWKQWKHLIDTEGWTSDDNSVTGLIPYLKSTRSVWAVTKTPEQNLVGSVVWNEYDDICWLGFYILRPEYRGKGIGSVIWNQSMSRIRRDLVLALRGVVKMAPRYKARDTPEDGAILENYRMSSNDFHDALKNYKSLDLNQKIVRDLSSEDWEKFLNYDKNVTGRDRHEFLEIYYKKLDYTLGIAFFDESGEIVGVISAVPTGHIENNFYKISPLFANSENVAFHAMKILSNEMLKRHPKATLIFHLVDTPEGSFTVLHRFFKNLGLTAGISGITLYSDKYPPKGNLSKVFIPHNNSCHFDY